MLVFDREFKPKAAYKDYHNELVSQISKPTPPGKPFLKPYNVKAYPRKSNSYDYSFHPNPFKQEHVDDDVFGVGDLKHENMQTNKPTDLEETVLKPLLGVPHKEPIEAENPNYYQFKLKGKTDKDIMINNMQKDPTPHDNLVENATTGESLPEIKQTQKWKDIFNKVVEEKHGKGHLTRQETDQLIKTKDAKIATNKDFKTQVKRGLKLKPVVPEVIPITEDDAAAKAAREGIDEAEKEETIRKPKFSTSSKESSDSDDDETFVLPFEKLQQELNKEVKQNIRKSVKYLIKTPGVDVSKFTKETIQSLIKDINNYKDLAIEIPKTSQSRTIHETALKNAIDIAAEKTVRERADKIEEKVKRGGRKKPELKG